MAQPTEKRVNGAKVVAGAEYGRAPLEQWTRKQITGLRPDYLHAVITRAERGDTEDLMDVYEFMRRSDPELRHLYDTLLSEVASLPREFEAPTDDPIDVDFAAWCSEAWEQIPDRDDAMSEALHAVGVGMTAGEQSFRRQGGQWYPNGWEFAEPRDVRFASDWTPVVRTFASNTTRGDWLDTSAEPARWLIHRPGTPGIPDHLSGLFLPAAWYWMFKKWVLIWGNKALERNGAGFWVGTVPASAPREVRTKMKQTLQRLSAGHVAVVEEGSKIELLESDDDPGESHREQAKYYDDALTKLFLGSTLIVDSGVRGARSLGEEQSERTVMPRWRRMARRLDLDIARQTFGPLAVWNAHRYGGQVPRIPLMKVPDPDQKPEINELHIKTRTVTNDEVRKSAGLETRDDEWGKQLAIWPEDSGLIPEVGGPDPKASAREALQMSLPGLRKRTRRKTLGTSEDSPTQAELVPLPS